MARIRTIKPEFCTSEQLAECSMNARLLFALMWCFCDDGGVHPDSPKRLKMECFPADDITSADVAEWIDDLVRHGLLSRYRVGEEGFLRVTGWDKHQKIDQPTFKYPRECGEVPSSVRRTSAERSTKDQRKDVDRSPPEGKGREGNGVEGKGEEGAGAPAQPDLTEIGNAVLAAMGSDPSRHMGHFGGIGELLRQGITAEEIVAVANVIGTRPGWTAKRDPIAWMLARNGKNGGVSAFDEALGQFRAERDAPPPASPEEQALSQWRSRVRGWAEKRLWLASWGPKPGEPYCEAPRQILAEFGLLEAA